jgi:predicted lipoprotein with Yx(FWY)xxD motif
MKAFGRGPTILTLIGVAAVLGLSACGSDDGSSSSTASTPSSAGGETVSVATVSGVGTVLVDANGMALYSPDQEANGAIQCTGSCEAIWKPLTVSGGGEPTAAADVSGTVATVKRPDGSEQVTLDGAPLYTFSQDSGPAQVSGDGVSDSFGGQSFTWHVVTVGGSAAGGTSSTTTTTGSGGSGYSY